MDPVTMAAIGKGLEGATSAGPLTTTSPFSDRSPVNIAPIGVNLGAILQAGTQGSPENGGLAYDFISRYAGGGTFNPASNSLGKTSIIPWVVGISGVVTLGYFWLRGR